MKDHSLDRLGITPLDGSSSFRKGGTFLKDHLYEGLKKVYEDTIGSLDRGRLISYDKSSI